MDVLPDVILKGELRRRIIISGMDETAFNCSARWIWLKVGSFDRSSLKSEDADMKILRVILIKKKQIETAILLLIPTAQETL